MTSKTNLLETALQYADLGFLVFPVQPGGKKPLLNAQSSNGEPWGQSRDPAAIREAWTKYPDANIGIATGPGSGILVIDIDVDIKAGKNGWPAWRSLFPEGYQQPYKDCSVRTPRGGQHYYFRWPEGEQGIKSTASKLGKDLDVRGEGGFIVAPGSRKDDGTEYAFTTSSAPLSELPDAPPWLIEALRELKPPEPARVQLGDVGPVISASAQFLYAADVERLLGAVEDAQPGTRNDTVNSSGFQLGTYARVLGDAENLRQRLLDIVSAWTEDVREMVATATRAFDEGMASDGGVSLQLTDLQLAEMDLRDYCRTTLYGPDHAFSDAHGWLEWGGATWAPISDTVMAQRTEAALSEAVFPDIETVAAACREQARRNLDRGANQGPRSPQKVTREAGTILKGLKSEATVRHVVSLNRSSSWVHSGCFDTDPRLLGTPEGVVDLRSGVLRAGERSDYITKSTTVAPQAGEPAQWLKFLSEVFEGEPEKVAFVQRLLGYSLTGLTEQHKLFFFVGAGRNGKGVLLNTTLQIIGDYGLAIPPQLLLANSQGNDDPALASLEGRRLVVGSELPEGANWNLERVKTLTGGDTISARRLYRDPHQFQPQCALGVMANTKPSLKSVDLAIRERMVLLEFRQSFAGSRGDPELQSRLVEQEGPQILNWLIEGAQAYHAERSLKVPDSVLDASRAYLDNEDWVGQFLADRCELVADGFSSSSGLYQSYKAWAEAAGLRPVGQRTLTKRLDGRDGITRSQRNIDGCKTRGLVGVRVVDQKDENSPF